MRGSLTVWPAPAMLSSRSRTTCTARVRVAFGISPRLRGVSWTKSVSKRQMSTELFSLTYHYGCSITDLPHHRDL